MELQKHQVCALRSADVNSADQHSYILCFQFHGKKVSGIAVLPVGPSETPAAKWNCLLDHLLSPWYLAKRWKSIASRHKTGGIACQLAKLMGKEHHDFTGFL